MKSEYKKTLIIFEKKTNNLSVWLKKKKDYLSLLVF